MGYSPWGHKELDTDEQLTHIGGLCAKHHSKCFACIYSFHPHNPMKYHLGRYKYHLMVQRRYREVICLDLQPQQPEARSCALALVFGLQANSYTWKFQCNHSKLPGIPQTGLTHLPLSVFPFPFPSLPLPHLSGLHFRCQRSEDLTWLTLQSESISLFLGALCWNFAGMSHIRPGMNHLDVCLSP